jgi:hypothetical protein
VTDRPTVIHTNHGHKDHTQPLHTDHRHTHTYRHRQVHPPYTDTHQHRRHTRTHRHISYTRLGRHTHTHTHTHTQENFPNSEESQFRLEGRNKLLPWCLTVKFQKSKGKQESKIPRWVLWVEYPNTWDCGFIWKKPLQIRWS